MDIEKILSKNNIKWSWDTEHKCRLIKMCELGEPIYGYSDWPESIGQVYMNVDKILMEELQYFIARNEVYLIDCEECCGCGDW